MSTFRHTLAGFTEPLSDQLVRGADLLQKAIDHGADPEIPYTPAFVAVRSKSRGYVHRYLSILSFRVLHLLSQGECRLAQILEASQEFTNVREGFALPFELTLPLAISLGIPHPLDPFEHQFWPMTVDFMCTKHDGSFLAVDFKMDKDAGRPRVREKLFLAQQALELVGVEHKVVTASQLSDTLVQNIELLYPLHYEEPPLGRHEHEAAAAAMHRQLVPGKLTILQAARQLAATFACAPATLVRTSLYQIAHKHWAVDLNLPLHPCRPVVFIEGGAA